MVFPEASASKGERSYYSVGCVGGCVDGGGLDETADDGGDEELDERLDVVILYCEKDRDAAREFERHLREDIRPACRRRVKASLYHEWGGVGSGSMMQRLSTVVSLSTYVFVFLTENFVSDRWCEFYSDSCLMEAIENPMKRWSVVLEFATERSKLRVPMGLNALKGVNYYIGDEYYRKNLARLIGERIEERVAANNRRRREKEEKRKLKKLMTTSSTIKGKEIKLEKKKALSRKRRRALFYLCSELVWCAEA